MTASKRLRVALSANSTEIGVNRPAFVIEARVAVRVEQLPARHRDPEPRLAASHKPTVVEDQPGGQLHREKPEHRPGVMRHPPFQFAKWVPIGPLLAPGRIA